MSVTTTRTGGLSRIEEDVIENIQNISEKTEVVKKGGGGGLSFLTESKKTMFFDAPP